MKRLQPFALARIIITSAATAASTVAWAAPANAHSPSVAIGESHLCALTDKGKALCWGANEEGQIGNATLGDVIVEPSEVFGLSDVKAIAAGAAHTCALLADGTVKCWGGNADGQLGAGPGFKHAKRLVVPIQVDGLASVEEIALGAHHSCARTSAGKVFCWGRNELGQLGRGARDSSSPSPSEVKGLPDAVRITAGRDHSCAVTRAGDLYCWGSNWDGQLGLKNRTNSLQAEKVPHLSRIRQVAAGGEHTCAMDDSGQPSCWGSSSAGQLGNPLSSSLHFAAVVTGTDEYAEIVTGSEHSCGLLTDGAVKCWGKGRDGQLGIESSLSFFLPTDVPGVRSAIQIAAGYDRTCVVQKRGRLACWGKGLSASPERIQLPSRIAGPALEGNEGAVSASGPALASGLYHACAISNEGTTSCWGSNEYGQIGDSTPTGPHQVRKPSPVSGLEDVRSLAAGNDFTCALRIDGTVWCWGRNEGWVISPLPEGFPRNLRVDPGVYAGAVKIENLSEVTQISAGARFACALTLTQEIICWGENDQFQLGTPAASSNRGPYISLSSPAIRIAAGQSHACALTEAGTVWCWGSNKHGQLGATAPNQSSVAIQVPAVDRAVAITAGETFSCALVENGAVWCWGNNDRGELGQGHADPVPAPAPVAGLSDVIQIASGAQHTCALKADQSIWCWGWAGRGQLGTGEKLHFLTAPKQVSLPSGWMPVAIATGYAKTFAISDSGEVIAWGENHKASLATGDPNTYQRDPRPSILPFPVRASGVVSPGLSPLMSTSGSSPLSSRAPAQPQNTGSSSSSPNDAKEDSDRFDNSF